MKRYLKNVLTLAVALIMCFNLAITSVLAATVELDHDDAAPQENVDYGSCATNVAPEGYVPRDEYIDSGVSKLSDGEHDDTPRVLLVEDILPWDSNANQTILSQLTEYDKVNTAGFLQCDLSRYGVIVFANDQPFSSYDNYEDFKEYMELFASIGGVIVFGACDGGWADGTLSEALPGDVTKKTHYVYYNYVVDETHPIISGSLIDNKVLTNDELYSNYCSHVSFDEESLPAGSKILLRESDTNRPTLVEYPLGKGRVIASGLTWEHNYVYYQAYNYGSYAATAMADMFQYAIRVSSIDVNDVDVLKEYYVNNNAHHIFVADKESNPIGGATVVIDGNEYLTDENGSLSYDAGYGIKQITVRAEGYKDYTLYYDLQPQQFKLVFLDEDANDGKPYVTMVSDASTFYDLRYQTRRFEKNSEDVLTLRVTANWAGQNPGTYVMYQVDSNKSIVSTDGVFSFCPGRTFETNKQIKIKLVSSNGVESWPIDINLFVDPVGNNDGGILAGEFENLTGIQITDNKAGSVNNSDISAIFPGDFELKISSLPLEVKKEVKNDGTVVYKGMIGLGRSNYLESDTKWHTFKKDFEKATENVGYANRLLATTKTFGGITIEKDLLDPEIKSVGYIEIIRDKNGNVIQSSGGVIISGGNTSKYSKQFLAGPVPIYVDLTGKVDVDIQFGLGYDFVEENWIYDGSLDVSGSIALGGGLGISGLVSVGVEGSAGIDINIWPECTGDAVFSADIKAYLIFVFDYTYNIATVTVPLWGDDNEAINMTSESKIDGSTITLASRDYNEKTSGWLNNPVFKLGLEDNPQSIYTLQNYIMPNTTPELVKVDDDYILIFQSDVASRTSGNNVVMMYSVYDDYNDTWSSPVAVAQGASSDLFAESFVIDNELYVVWQKISDEMTSTDANALLGEMAQSIDISFAKWNKSTKSFDQAYVNDDGMLDMYPYLAVNNGELSIVWVSNSANDATGTEGTYTFYVSNCENGVWSAPVVVYQTQTYVTEVAAGYVNGNLEILFATNAGASGNIYRINAGDAALVPSQSAVGANLIFNDGYFYWASAGKITQYNAASNSVFEIKSGDVEAIMSSYRIVENATDTAIVWLVSDENGNETIYASVKKADSWSNPIELVKGMNIQYFDVELADNGAWHVICTVIDDYYEDMVSLTYVYVDIIEDTTLNYVDLDESERNGGSQPVELSVTNNGQSTLQSVNVVVTDKNGNEYYSGNVACDIASGDTDIINVTVDLSGLTECKELYFSVYAENELDSSDNTESETVGQVNVSLKLSQYTVGEKLVIAAEVTNASDISANTAISIIEDSTNGIVLDMKNIGILTKETSYVYLYSIDKSQIDFKGADHKYYYIVVNTLEDDVNAYDNTEIIAVYPTALDEHIHYTAETTLQYDATSHWSVCDDCGEPYDLTYHSYDNNCDGDCNDDNCAYVREIPHTPTNDDGDCATADVCADCGEAIAAKTHTYDNACDADCNNLGCLHERTVFHSVQADDGDCSTPVICTVCGINIEPAKSHVFLNTCDATCENEGCTYTREIMHTAYMDDGDCSTMITCAVCGEVTAVANSHVFDNECDAECNHEGCYYTRTVEHTPIEDDGDCTTPITCSVCNAVLTAAKSHAFKYHCDATCENEGCSYTREVTHTPRADDGDCTTIVKCEVCHGVAIEALEHTFDNDCDTDCNNPGCKYKREPVHTPDADDGSCLTEIACSVCGEVLVEAATHVFDNACDTKCNNAGCNFERTITHTPCADDGDCSTAVTCTVCGAVTTAALEHVFDGDCDTSCNNEGCKYARQIAHAYDDTCDVDCNKCQKIREIEHTYDNKYDKKCNVCGAEREAPVSPVLIIVIAGSVIVLAGAAFAVYKIVIKKKKKA